MPDTQPSSLLQYLPAIYREEPFLGRFLLAFEKLLFGRADNIGLGPAGTVPPALEQTISDIATYFDPQQTREDFVPWLVSWTAFSLRADLDLTQQRAFIARIIPLYRGRGTKRNLEELLQIFTEGTPTVGESATSTAASISATTLTVGGTIAGLWARGQMVSGGTTAAGTYIVKQITGIVGGAGTYEVSVSQTVAPASLDGIYDAHHFGVKVSLRGAAPAMTQRQIAITGALIDLEKPAHTYCDLQFDFPTMQIGTTSHIGVDTLLGTHPATGGPG